MRAALVLVWGGALACVGPESLDLAPPTGARTLLLIVETAHRGLRFEVYDLEAGAAATSLTLETGDAYYSLFYEESLATLGLEGLRLTTLPCRDDVPARPVPKPALFRGQRIAVDGPVAITDVEVAALFQRVWIDPGERCAAGLWQRLDGVVDACPATWSIEVESPSPPAPPELPRACDACDTPTFDSRRACGPFEAHFLGRSGCSPIGGGCPGGGVWQDTPVGTLWVVAGATGIGTEADPSGDLEAIIAAAPEGATIAIDGELLLTLAIDVERDLTIRGLCPERARIVGTLHAMAPLRLMDLTIGGRTEALLADFAPVHLDGVLVEGEGGGGEGIITHAAELTLVDSVIRGWRHAVQVTLGSMEVERTNFEGSIFSVTTSSAAFGADSVVISNELGHSELGWGIQVDGRESAELRRVLVDGVWGRGLIGQAHAQIGVADLVLRNIEGVQPIAIDLDSCTLTSTRVAIDLRSFLGVWPRGTTVARFEDLTVECDGALDHPDGIKAKDGSRVILERAKFRGSKFKDGIHLTSKPTEPHLIRDVEIDGVDLSAAMVASAIHLSNATLILERASIHDWAEGAIDLSAQASLLATDLDIRGAEKEAIEIAPLVQTRDTKIKRLKISDTPTAIRFSSGAIILEDVEISAAGSGFQRYLSDEYLEIDVDRFVGEVSEVGFELGDLGNAPMHFRNGSMVVSRVGEIVRYAEACEPHPDLFERVGGKITPD